MSIISLAGKRKEQAIIRGNQFTAVNKDIPDDSFIK